MGVSFCNARHPCLSWVRQKGKAMADVIVIAVLACVLALIVRGMLRGTIKSCEGNCGSCGHVCSAPRLKLTDEQKAQLAEIDKRSGVSR